MDYEMLIDEQSMIDQILRSKRILLIEPNFPRKYPPLSLAKFSTFCKQNGIEVAYSRQMVYEKFDLILVTTLFTYYSDFVKEIINARGLYHRNTPIIVGGVFASLNPEWFEQFKGIQVYKSYSKVIDLCPPDRTIMDLAEEPWDTFSWVFTSRGCVNKCAYCAVPRIEKEHWVNPSWRDHIFPDKPNVLISDNNMSAVSYDHLKMIIDHCNSQNKAIMFEGGVDCKYVDPKMAKVLASAKYVRHGLRMAFDRIEEDGIFQTAARNLIDAGVSMETTVQAFLLFNFNDTPQDAYYRGRECFKLGIGAYPMMYRPLNALNKDNPFVGKHWTLNLARAFRHYWMYRSFFKYFTFEDFLKLPTTVTEFNLTKPDLDKWYHPTVPFKVSGIKVMRKKK